MGYHGGINQSPSISYVKLRNRSYSIMLNYADSPSTPRVRLSRPGPTISSSRSSPSLRSASNTDFVNGAGHVTLVRYEIPPPPNVHYVQKTMCKSLEVDRLKIRDPVASSLFRPLVYIFWRVDPEQILRESKNSPRLKHSCGARHN